MAHFEADNMLADNLTHAAALLAGSMRMRPSALGRRGPGGMRVRSWMAATAVVGALCVLVAAPAQAQQRGLTAVEVVTGYAGFIDEVWDNRVMAGGVVRFALAPRFAIGPEVVYLHGPEGSHEVTVTGSGTLDFFRPAVARRVVPFIVFGLGLLRQSSLVGGGPGRPGLFPYSSYEISASGGIGARILIGQGLFIAPDARLGWEPETRLSVTLGWRP
jgi:hypothetical protein